MEAARSRASVMIEILSLGKKASFTIVGELGCPTATRR